MLMSRSSSEASCIGCRGGSLLRTSFLRWLIKLVVLKAGLLMPVTLNTAHKYSPLIRFTTLV